MGGPLMANHAWDTGGTEELADRWMEPFGRAFAAFVNELSPSPPAAAPDVEIDESEAVDIDDAFQGSLGSRIRIAMAERQISKAMLARETGLSPGVIARAIENPDNAKLGTLKKMAASLRIQLPAFLSA